MILSAAKRKTMPADDFAGPDRSYPVTDKTHARMAISGASRAYNVHHISLAMRDRIQAKARRALKRMKSK